MLSAQLIPIDTPNQKYKDPQVRWVDEVNSRLFNNKPSNVANIATLSRQIYKEFFVEYNNPSNGAVRGVWPEYTLLPKPTTNYRVNNINSLIFTLSWIVEIPGTAGFAGFPTGDSNWSVDFYVYFTLRNPVTGNFSDQLIPDPQAVWQVKYTVNYVYNAVSPDPFGFTITSPYIEYNLFDTIADRPTGSTTIVVFDGINDDKVTQGTLNRLLREPNSLRFTFAANKAQYDALSSANKMQFLELFGSRFEYAGLNPIAETTGVLRSSLDMSLTYAGMLADYKPFDN